MLSWRLSSWREFNAKFILGNNENNPCKVVGNAYCLRMTTTLTTTALNDAIAKITELMPSVSSMVKGTKNDDFDYLFHTDDGSGVAKLNIITARHIAKGWAKPESKGSVIRIISAL